MVTIYIHSYPNQIRVWIGADPEGTSSQITMAGLVPGNNYYRYEDSYASEPVQFLADSSGRDTFTLELLTEHVIMIELEESTITLDASGSECSSPDMTWYLGTKTCKLNSDLTNTFVIKGSGITLGGAGHTLETFGTGIDIFSSSNNKIYNNNFVTNIIRAVDNYTGLNQWDSGGYLGGNYWDSYDEASEGCLDSEPDFICDDPLELPDLPSTAQDNAPWTVPDGWLDATEPTETTPPIITVNIEGTLGNNGWYTDTVAISWLVVDEESEYTSTGCGTSTVSADTAGKPFTCSALSLGGPASVSVIVKREATPPSASASAAPQLNGAGWNNNDVIVSFNGSDDLSGIAASYANETISRE